MLSEIPGIRPVYLLPSDPLAEQLLIPCLRTATQFDCMVGFFSSASLRDIAAGLANFLAVESQVMRLVFCPQVSEDDLRAIETGILRPANQLEQLLRQLLQDAWLSERALVRHTLDCLSYLLASGRMEIKVALMKKGGLFHPKVWILECSGEVLVAHGSNNLTSAGIRVNYEQVSVSRSWMDETQREVVEVLKREFAALWSDSSQVATTFNLPDAIAQELLVERSPQVIPTEQDYIAALDEDVERGYEVRESSQSYNGIGDHEPCTFNIPDYLEYETGDFAHQGRAVAAWENNGHRGILEMATGSGKTIAALIAAYHLFERTRSLLLVIAAPYKPLVSQWREEAEAFGLEPLLPGEKGGRQAKLESVAGAVRALVLGSSVVECMVVTHDLLCDGSFQQLIGAYDGESLLIGDEVHNLGRPTFVSRPPDSFTSRLGLSATPVRQYDEEGTEQLIDFFGEVVFKFTLEEAIGKCLVPYRYYVHPVHLDTEELEQWVAVTEKLKTLGWMHGLDDSRENSGKIPEGIKLLLLKRRRVVEQARAKVIRLAELLGDGHPRTRAHTLIYASDKGRSQLDSVNELLRNIGLRFHQVTAKESSNSGLTAQILKSFRSGSLQALTAMRVLDEGVNIPEIREAFILASTTVERQWVQRRGRILRLCPEIGKTEAILHDFLVLPSESYVGDASAVRSLAVTEAERVLAFGRAALNSADEDGPIATISPILDSLL